MTFCCSNFEFHFYTSFKKQISCAVAIAYHQGTCTGWTITNCQTTSFTVNYLTFLGRLGIPNRTFKAFVNWLLQDCGRIMGKMFIRQEKVEALN